MRKNRTKNPPWEYPDKVCRISRGREANILTDIYNKSVSNLAEALCDESPTHEEAKRHTKSIAHANTNLQQWLKLFHKKEFFSKIRQDSSLKFIVLPLAKQSKSKGSNNHTTIQKQSNFQMHILQAARELLIDHIGESATNALMRAKPPKSQEQLEQEQQRNIHSSLSQKQKPPPISILGECCLTRFLEVDYQLIRTMLLEGDNDALLEGSGNSMANLAPFRNAHPLLKTGCSWGTEEEQVMCREDLLSILERRLPFLDRSRGSCSDVVAALPIK